MDHNPYASPKAPIEVTPATGPQDGPDGLGGWLVVIALGLFATPIRLVIVMVQTYPPLFGAGRWEKLTTPGSPHYHPLWKPLVIGEVVANFVFIAFAVYLLYLFFRKSRRFPSYYIGLLVSSIVFILADSFVVGIVVPGQGITSAGSMQELTRSLVASAIWIPYLFVSKRVRNTFVQLN